MRVASLVRLTVPMIAVSVSANVNLLLVRRHELSEGIPVVTSDGEPLGLGVTAAKRGLLECAATRVLWTFLLLTATPLCVSAAFASLPHRLASSKSRQGIMVRAALELGMSFVVIWLSVPLSIAAFPQRESMPIQELEETVQLRWRELVKGGRYVHSDHAEVDVHVHAMQAPEAGHVVTEFSKGERISIEGCSTLRTAYRGHDSVVWGESLQSRRRLCSFTTWESGNRYDVPRFGFARDRIQTYVSRTSSCTQYRSDIEYGQYGIDRWMGGETMERAARGGAGCARGAQPRRRGDLRVRSKLSRKG